MTQVLTLARHLGSHIIDIATCIGQSAQKQATARSLRFRPLRRLSEQRIDGVYIEHREEALPPMLQRSGHEFVRVFEMLIERSAQYISGGGEAIYARGGKAVIVKRAFGSPYDFCLVLTSMTYNDRFTLSSLEHAPFSLARLQDWHRSHGIPGSAVTLANLPRLPTMEGGSCLSGHCR